MTLQERLRELAAQEEREAADALDAKDARIAELKAAVVDLLRSGSESSNEAYFAARSRAREVLGEGRKP